MSNLTLHDLKEYKAYRWDGKLVEVEPIKLRTRRPLLIQSSAVIIKEESSIERIYYKIEGLVYPDYVIIGGGLEISLYNTVRNAVELFKERKGTVDAKFLYDVFTFATVVYTDVPLNTEHIPAKARYYLSKNGIHITRHTGYDDVVGGSIGWLPISPSEESSHRTCDESIGDGI